MLEYVEMLSGVALFLLGFLTKSISDYFNHKRVLQRDSVQREEERADTYRLRRFNFQMDTLVQVQDAVFDLARNTSQINHHDYMNFKKGEVWKSIPIPLEIDIAFLKNQQKVIKLKARIRNEGIRDLIALFMDETLKVTTATSVSESERYMLIAMRTKTELDERIGEEFGLLDSDESY